MDAKELKNILEAGLLVAGRALSVAQLEALFQHEDEGPDKKAIRAALEELQKEYEGRGIELVEVASGFRLQSHESVSDWVANLFQEKTPRYSRALLETLVLIAYRQPITRAEIEDVRGVAVSSNIIKTLQERSWVKVLGHKEVPGKPALLGTTKDFLDYFNLKKLDDLPELADIKDLDQFDALLAAEAGEEAEGEEEGEADDAATDSAPSSANNATANGVVSASDDSSQANEDSASDDDQSEDSGEVEGEDNQSPMQGKDSDSADGDDASESAHLTDSAAGSSVWNMGAGSKGVELDSGESDSEEFGSEHSDNESSDTDDMVSDEHGSDESDQSEGDESGGDDQNEIHNETLTGAEQELMRVISDFSDEHQQEIDARDEMEAGILSNSDEKSDEQASDLSQRIDDQHPDGPTPGDTLH